MSGILDAIDRAVDGLCPCGADPRPGSAYCSYDCEPNHIAIHTDRRESGELATPMRWRPDLVTAVDDSGLILLARKRRGPYSAQVFGRDEGFHLRLDDGHRFVGLNIDCAVPTMPGDLWDRTEWQTLERELGNDRHVERPGAELEYARAAARFILASMRGRRTDAVLDLELRNVPNRLDVTQAQLAAAERYEALQSEICEEVRRRSAEWITAYVATTSPRILSSVSIC